MEISKLRSDRVQDAKVSENKGAGSAQTAKDIASGDLNKASQSSSAKSAENISWSSDASMISEGVQAAKQSPDVRAERIAELKNAIRSGSYKVDAQGVADKMLQSAFEEDLLTRKS